MEDADIDELRRRDSVEKTGDFNADYDIPKPIHHDKWMPLKKHEKFYPERKMVYNAPSLNQKRPKIFESYDMEIEPMFGDPYQLLSKHRQKRANGKEILNPRILETVFRSSFTTLN